MAIINIDLESIWQVELKIIGFLLLVFSIFGIWFTFHVRSWRQKNRSDCKSNMFLTFLFPIALILIEGINLLFDNPSVLLDYAMMATSFAWVITFVVYEILLRFKNKNIQKIKGQ